MVLDDVGDDNQLTIIYFYKKVFIVPNAFCSLLIFVVDTWHVKTKTDVQFYI